MCDQPGHEFGSKRLGKRTKASFALLGSAVAVVLLDIFGSVFLSGGHDIIGARLHDQLAVLALLSVPLTLIVLAIGAILGMMDWRAASKASVSPNLMTVVAASLNLALFLIGITIAGYFVWTFEPYIGG